MRIGHFLILFILLLQGCTKEKQPCYTLSIATIFKNEAPYLKEWIEYHRIVGVDHFFLFNNESIDGYKEVLKPYIEQNIVTLTDWPDNEESPRKIYSWVFSTQVPALEYSCNILAKKQSKWIAFIDTDEFIVPIAADSVVKLLEKHDQEVGVAISWHTFGTSHVRNIGDRLMIETLTRCTTLDDGMCKPVKTIAKVDKFVKFAPYAPHYCEFLTNSHALHLAKDEIVINHYINRDLDYFNNHKLQNRAKMVNRELTINEIFSMAEIGNSMEDDKKHIFRFIPELKKRMESPTTIAKSN